MAKDLQRQQEPHQRPQQAHRRDQVGHSVTARPAGSRPSERAAPIGRTPLSLNDPVQYLPGVGPRRAELLGALGVRTAGDLLEYLPFRHDQFEPTSIIHLEPGRMATVVGRITRVRSGDGRSWGTVTATITDNTAHCAVRWFNSHYI